MANALILSLACAFGAAIPSASTQTAAPAEKPVPVLAQTSVIQMPLVQGRMDHLAFDAAQQTLYVAALANNTLETIDVAAGKLLPPRTTMKEPTGIVFLDATGEVAVANGGNGDLDVVKGDAVRKVHLGLDADNVRFDHRNKRVIVAFGSGGLAIVDSTAWKVEGVIELGGHPESFQLSADGKRAWANVPGKQQYAVIDMVARKVLRWVDVGPAKKNYPMALVEAEQRLLVGCREPARLLVYDTDSDALIAELPLSGDVDDIFLDAARHRVYASCGEGFVDVFERAGPGAWKPKEKIATAAGARTCLFVASEKKLFVAVPHRGEQKAEVRVFSTAP